MTTATVTESGFDLSFAMPMSGGKQTMPALQVNTYQPAKTTEPIVFCLSHDSAALIADHLLPVLDLEPIDCEYELGKITTMLKISESVRWVLLGNPRIYSQSKIKDKPDIKPLAKGDKLKENGRVTVAKLFLGCTHPVTGALLMQDETTPLVVTLKLTSNKTRLISDVQDLERKTFAKLNDKLCDMAKSPGSWLCHLVSVKLLPKAAVFDNGKDKSLGIDYELADGAKTLAKSEQGAVFAYINTPEFKALAADPFKIGGTQAIEGELAF
jgi:hypothetical protein